MHFLMKRYNKKSALAGAQDMIIGHTRHAGRDGQDTLQLAKSLKLHLLSMLTSKSPFAVTPPFVPFSTGPQLMMPPRKCVESVLSASSRKTEATARTHLDSAVILQTCQLRHTAKLWPHTRDLLKQTCAGLPTVLHRKGNLSKGQHPTQYTTKQ